MLFESRFFSHVCFLAGCLCALAVVEARVGQAEETLSASSLPTLTNSIGMKLVQIPAGRFSMGSPASEPGSREDETLHKVELSQPYYLGITEVTEHQWALVMEDAFRTEEREVRDPQTKRLIKKEEVQIRNRKLDSQLPITNVSWQQAVEFCERLGQLPEEKKEGRNYRLPTEAEWEHACRAGTASAYNFGDKAVELKNYGWYRETKAWTYDPENFPQWTGRIQPVGKLRPNPWGIYDMHGNVAEWCFDWYGDYEEGFASDPSGPSDKQRHRVIRGGHIYHQAVGCRSAIRYSEHADVQDKLIGFRVVLGQGIANQK